MEKEDNAMALSLPDARQLSDEVLDALRLRALRGRELGFTEADLADLLGVSRETVSRWWSASSSRGLDALPRGRSGGPLGSGRLPGAAGPPPRPRPPPPRGAAPPHPGAPRRPQPRRPWRRRPAVEPPRRARVDPQGVRHRVGRADRRRVPRPLGLSREEAASPRPQAGPRGDTPVVGRGLS